METLKQRAGKIIRAKRIAAGYKRQGSFAEALGCDQSRVSQWESGKEMPDTGYREKMNALIKTVDADFEPAVISQSSALDVEAVATLAAEKALAKANTASVPEEYVKLTPQQARLMKLMDSVVNSSEPLAYELLIITLEKGAGKLFERVRPLLNRRLAEAQAQSADQASPSIKKRTPG